MVDPGLPREGGPNPKGMPTIIWLIFPENYMKTKKFWARGGHASLAHPPLDPSLTLLEAVIDLNVRKMFTQKVSIIL